MSQIRDIPGNPGRVATLVVAHFFSALCSLVTQTYDLIFGILSQLSAFWSLLILSYEQALHRLMDRKNGCNARGLL